MSTKVQVYAKDDAEFVERLIQASAWEARRRERERHEAALAVVVEQVRKKDDEFWFVFKVYAGSLALIAASAFYLLTRAQL